MISFNLENNIILRDVYKNSMSLCDCENGIFNNLIGTLKIEDGAYYYIEGSASETEIHDKITDTIYTGNIKDFLILEMIDKVFRTLLDHSIEISEILPDNYWTKTLTFSDIILLKDAYKYVEHLIPFNFFVSLTHLTVMHDCYKLFLMYNFVKGKKDEIIDKYHCKSLGFHIWFDDIFNHLNDDEQDVVMMHLPAKNTCSYYEQVIFNYIESKDMLRSICNRSYFNKRNIVFDDKNNVIFNEALLSIIKINIDKFSRYFIEGIRH